jgi:hypothetical protein
MNLFRLVILGLLAWLVVRVVRSWASEGGPSRPQPRKPEQYEVMGRCLGCGVFVPRDALNENGRCRSCERNR